MNIFLKKKRDENETLGHWIDNRFGTLSILPALIGLAIVLVYPVIVSLGWSFTNKSFMRNNVSFVGLKNYIELLSQPDVWISIRNGLLYTTMTICLQIIWGVGLAILLDRFMKGACGRIMRLFYMVPWTFPVIVSVFVWSWLYNDSGLISSKLYEWGLIASPMSFIATKATAFPAVVFVHAWSGTPLMMMSTLSGLQSIPQDQYEVGMLEGTNAFQNFRYIILPNVKRILQVIIVLRCVWIFNNFNLIFLLTGGGPGTSTQNLPIMAYKYAWLSYEVGKSTSVSVIMLIILFCIFLMYQFVNKKIAGGDDAF